MNKEKIDEIKNKIRMELQNLITQQGFEIICKHILELQADKGILTDELNTCQELLGKEKAKNVEQNLELTEAKELIKKLRALYFSPVVTNDDIKRQDEILNEVEAFINKE